MGPLDLIFWAFAISIAAWPLGDVVAHFVHAIRAKPKQKELGETDE